MDVEDGETSVSSNVSKKTKCEIYDESPSSSRTGNHHPPDLYLPTRGNATKTATADPFVAILDCGSNKVLFGAVWEERVSDIDSRSNEKTIIGKFPPGDSSSNTSLVLDMAKTIYPRWEAIM